jgi:hypothetical protein
MNNFNYPRMKTNLKTIFLFDSGYIDLSEQLRDKLELKIDSVYAQNRFNHYVDLRVIRFGTTAKSDRICAYLLSKAPKEYVLSGKLLQGVKTWFNMYYDDRLSVIDKFRTYYQNALSREQIRSNQLATIAFCKFLVGELLCILAESRWQDLVHLAD